MHMVLILGNNSSWGAKLIPTSLPNMPLHHLAMHMVVSLGNSSSWGAKLIPLALKKGSPTILFSCLQAISLVRYRIFLFTPTHMAIPMAVQ